jgi:hypothetical protein
LDDLDKKVDHHVQKDVNDLQKKVGELLKMAHALERQRQKEKTRHTSRRSAAPRYEGSLTHRQPGHGKPASHKEFH